MKSYRVGLLIIALSMLAFAFFQVGGFALDNPTGRRISSQSVAITGSTTVEVGDSGERVLAGDLSLVRNDSPSGDRVCVCQSQRALQQSRRCDTAPVVARTVNTCHIPDFFTEQYIAEAKNVTALRLTDQLRAFILMAETLNMPLWIYVRVDTTVSATLMQQVQQTGGDVIPYFRSSGYIDDDIISGIMVGLGGVLLIVVMIWPKRRGRPAPRPKGKPAPPMPLDDLESAVSTIRERSRRTIDEEDSQH